MYNFLSNPWTIGIGTAVIAAIIVSWFRLNGEEEVGSKNSPQLDSTLNQSNSQVQNVTINNAVKNGAIDTGNALQEGLSSSQISLFKQDAKILFIDDLDLKKKISNLKDAGWERVSQIEDAPNIDIQDIREADVIFVDYKGIGETGSEEQGLSILSALKHRYKDSKYLILYSAHSVPVDAFNRGANNYLSKNSTIYELEQKILEGIAKIKK